MLSKPTNPPRNAFAVVSQLGPRTRQAIAAVAAKMALADGHVEPVEQRSLLTFLKRQNLLLTLGRADMNQRFAGEIERAAGHSPAGDQQDLLDRLRPLAGMEAARLIATAAAHVAAADGIVHPAELALLRSLREALGLAPATGGAPA